MAKVYIKLNPEGFASLNQENKESFPEVKYTYSLNQYQPFGEDIWYEVKLPNETQKEEIISNFKGVETTGSLLNGAVSPDGKIKGGAYVQETDSKGVVSTKFLETNKIKAKHKVLV